ncbi:MAG: serine O-acetyltransferase [Arachnia sp.]
MSQTVPDSEVWERIREEARSEAEREPLLVSFLHESILRHDSLPTALATLLAGKLHTHTMPAMTLRDLLMTALASANVSEQIVCDLQAIVQRDPATRGYSQPLLHLKGYQSVESYRAAHYFWNEGRQAIALFIHSRMSETFGVDIHPAARLGRRLMVDHATSVVIGETAVVGDDVSMLHEVTLGGTGKVGGDRHPKIGSGVMIGSGAKILGNITVGEGAKIGAGSVVLHDVAPHTTVAGVPAKPIAVTVETFPAHEMDQNFDAFGFDPPEGLCGA